MANLNPHLKLLTLFCLLLSLSLQAQIDRDSSLIITDSDNLVEKEQIKDSIHQKERFKADGVAAVIGEFLILDSDVSKMREDMKNQEMDQKVSDCQLIGRLMENKLYAQAAKQDTTLNVSNQQINSQIDQQLQKMKQQMGSIDKVLDFYRKDDVAGLREELFTINKERRLGDLMQERVVEEVEVTPEEVRQFFENIPEDERPQFGDEVEIAQIVIKPEVPQTEIDKVLEKLRDMRADIKENGSSFATKAVLYSEDRTSTKGGQMTITRDSPLDKDFKQVAFSLREGEISKPFKSAFGYHILKVDKIRGQKLDIRHVILIPKVTQETVQNARKKMDSVHELIDEGEMSFEEAAQKYSDDDKTSADGGQLINPDTDDTRFEMTKVPPLIYDQVNNLDEGEVSKIISDQTKTGKKFFKIIYINGKYPAHVADYSKDYTKIKDLALRKKKLKAVQEWQKNEIQNTYIKINGKYRDCTFESNWLKKD